MINRIVKLSFRPDHIEDFLTHYDLIKSQLLNQPGCISVNLLQYDLDPTVFFTYSQWRSIHDLTIYRQSDFFKKTWSKIKPWFASKAEAWSTKQIA